MYTHQYGAETLKNHFGTKNLKGFGINHLEEGIVAAGAALQYLADTQHKNTDHIHSLVRIEEEKYMWVDGFTAANLEILRPNQSDGTCLLDILDSTETPMGSRLIKRWAAFPLKDKAPIEQRLDAVEKLINHPNTRQEIEENLKKIDGS